MAIRTGWTALLFCLIAGPALFAEPAKPVDKAHLKAVKDWLDAESADGKAKAAAALAKLDRLPVEAMEQLLRAAHPAPKASGTLTRQVKLGAVAVPYLVRLPANYDPAKLYPVMYFMWGPGTNARPGVDQWAFLADWILVSPQLPQDNPERPGFPLPESGCTAFRLVMMDLFGAVAVDQDRVFVGGFSQGGVMASWISGFLPDRCAGGIAVAAYALHHFNIAGEHPLNGNAVHVPSYVANGDKDSTVPIETGRETERELKAVGASFVYRELPGVGHDLPDAEQKKIAEWCKDLRRERWPRRVVQATSHKVNPAGRAYWVQFRAGDPGVLFLEAKILADNRIEVTTEKVARFELLLNEKLVDFAKEVVVTVNGKEVHRGKVEPSARTVLEGFATHRDPGLLYSAVVPVQVP